MSECCLTPNEQCCSYIMVTNMWHSMKWWWCPLNWIFIVLAQWNNNSRVDVSLHSGTLSWLRAITLINLCAANTHLILIGLTRPWLVSTIYRGEHDSPYTIDVVTSEHADKTTYTISDLCRKNKMTSMFQSFTSDLLSLTWVDTALLTLRFIV